jgi:stearoyl-CoA desaturase (delta-9 desaturase)
MLCASMANEGSIFHWVRDHRVHHKYSETNADPHNATRGFFFAHCGWLLIKKHPDVIKAGRDIDLTDLLNDPVVMFQKKCDPWINVFMCFFFPAIISTALWGEDFWNGVMVTGFLRYVVVLHFTWMVNSAAHLYGDHPYDTASYPAENPFVAIVTGGEGWHNWHHKYPYDYATSEFGGFAQYNLGKGAIDLFCWLGLAWGRKRATAAWAHGRARRDKDAAAGIPIPRVETRPWEKKKQLANEIKKD